MASGDVPITIAGNLTADPELRYTPTGQAVANFTVASTPRYLDKASNEWKDGDTLFLRCNVWRQAAENVAESLQRGMRVIVTGRLRQRSYETREGEKCTVYEVTAVDQQADAAGLQEAISDSQSGPEGDDLSPAGRQADNSLSFWPLAATRSAPVP